MDRVVASIIHKKKGCDLLLERAPHKKRPKGAYCFCLGMI